MDATLDWAELYSGMGGVEVDLSLFRIDEMHCIGKSENEYSITIVISPRKSTGAKMTLILSSSQIVWFPLTEYAAKLVFVNNRHRKLQRSHPFTVEIVNRHGDREIAINARGIHN